MLSLLKIKVSGYKMLEDNLTIDFLTKARVYDEDLISDVFKIDENLYSFNTIAFTGKNSSGKSSVLELIDKVLVLMQTGRMVYDEHDFNSDKIKLHIEFYLNDEIYLYDSEILPPAFIDPYVSFCRICNETLKTALYNVKRKNYLENLNFKTYEPFASGIEDTSSLVFVCKDQIHIERLEFKKDIYWEGRFFNDLQFYNKELTISIIRLFDDSIENLECVNHNFVKLKRFGQEEQKLLFSEFLSLMSNGTLKGIEVFVKIIRILQSGGYFIIDEIENCFHKNLINNILFLFNNESINKKRAQLIFSTHYVEVLDLLDRRDNINIMQREGCSVRFDNLYQKYKVRTEILKSKQFDANTFNTLLNYDALMKVVRGIKNEICNND